MKFEREVCLKLGTMETKTETDTMTIQKNNLYRILKEEIRTHTRVTRPGGPLITSDSAVRSIGNKDDFLFGLKGFQKDAYESCSIYVLYFKNIVIKIDIQQSYYFGSYPKEDKITTFELDSPLLFLNMNDVINIVFEDSIADGNKIDWTKDWLSDQRFQLKIENADLFGQLNNGWQWLECKIVKNIRKQIGKLSEKNDSKKMQYQLDQQQSLILSMQNQLQEQSKLIASLQSRLVLKKEEEKVEVDMFADWLKDDEEIKIEQEEDETDEEEETEEDETGEEEETEEAEIVYTRNTGPVRIVDYNIGIVDYNIGSSFEVIGDTEKHYHSLIKLRCKWSMLKNRETGEKYYGWLFDYPEKRLIEKWIEEGCLNQAEAEEKRLENWKRDRDFKAEEERKRADLERRIEENRKEWIQRLLIG
jgi:chemotaxis protein histidine kinase CheA